MTTLTMCLVMVSLNAQTPNNANFKVARPFPNSKMTYENEFLSISYDASWKLSKKGDSPEHDKIATWKDSVWETST
ncbi:MAG: hypothetical protein M9887_05595 [Chitinophagales bacterium]|nr:hypothetical protein [Chitinophagales bacterium]